MIRLRYDDATTHSTTTEVDRNYDSTAIRPRQDYDEKIDVLIFCSRRTRHSQSLGNRHCRSGAAGLHDVTVYVTTNMAFMNDKEVEYLINLYQSERSLWDSNDECY